MNNTIKTLDLFAGAGGLSLGFELFRNGSGEQVFELHRAVESEKYACETLRNRYGKEKVVEGDLTEKATHEKIISECGGKISVVMGGIPCQSFSTIGPRSGFGKTMEKFRKDERDHLYREFKSIVAELMPHILVIENVKGILSKKDSDGRKIIDAIISDFERIGYRFDNNKGEKYLLLNAADFGVPQKRERVILIGINREWKDIPAPDIQPTHYDPDQPDSGTTKGLLPYVTLSEAIGDLPKVTPKITETGLSKNQITRVRAANRNTDSGQERRPFNKTRFEKHLKRAGDSAKQFLNFIRPNGYEYIDHHIARMQQLTDVKLFRYMREGETAEEFCIRRRALAKKLIKYDMETFTDKYRKQSRDKPCTTVFAHLEKDGNRFIHPSQARTLTPREAARIQSFPDDFIFSGPFSKKFRQIGNAVPPLMAYNIARAVYKILDEQQ